MIAVWTLLLASAWAYIPEYAMIASRAAEQHGKGAYQIEQDVTIRKEAESFSVREIWTVYGENSMLLKLEGKGPLKGLVSGTVIYDGNSRIFYDGSIRSQKLGDEWLEPLFHFRNSKFFRSKLVSLKVAPQESLRDRAPLASEGEVRYEAPNYVRLSRAGGGLSWAIGMNPAAGDSPTLWLEQDQFVMRKIKLLNQSIVRADDYVKYDKDESLPFWYPRSRSYQFGGFTVQVQTVRVQKSDSKPGKDPAFRPSTLVSNKEVLKLPDMDGLRDFYQRFR